MECNCSFSIETVRKTFKEMFEEQQKHIIVIISNNSKIINDGINKVTEGMARIKSSILLEVEKNNERIKQLESNCTDLQNSIEVTENILEDKINNMDNLFEKKTRGNCIP